MLSAPRLRSVICARDAIPDTSDSPLLSRLSAWSFERELSELVSLTSFPHMVSFVSSGKLERSARLFIDPLVFLLRKSGIFAESVDASCPIIYNSVTAVASAVVILLASFPSACATA